VAWARTVPPLIRQPMSAVPVLAVIHTAAEIVTITIPEGGTTNDSAGQFAFEKSVHTLWAFHAPALT
jgi:hypothetical protein